MTKFYILNKKGEVEETTNPIEWANFMTDWNKDARIIARDLINDNLVSTVFLGTDMSYGNSEKPVLWETMVFGEPAFSDYQERYSSKEEALIGHKQAIKKILDHYEKKYK